MNRVGEENVNNFGSKMIIVRYKTNKDIDVYFPEYNYTVINRCYSDFKRGYIKCPYERRAYGVGYLGEGKYKFKENSKNTIYYDKWLNMLERCYYKKYQEKHPTYKGCSTCKEWHNFQNFAKWCDENYYEVGNQKMCLDKDILHKKNKIYSPETCIFVPQRINLLFTKNDRCRGDLPIGVRHNNNKYQAVCKNGHGKTITLGTYKTINEAFSLYKTYKESMIKSVAEEYKNYIHEKLYIALINYKVEITD